MLQKKIAFTLAEVLITLGIIGIVAEVTIPALMQQTQDKEFKTAYKQAYSDASNIWRSMVVNYEVVPAPDLASVTGDVATYGNFDLFKAGMQVSKDCGTGSAATCWDMTGESLNEVYQGGGEIAPSKPNATNVRGFIDSAGRDWLMVRGGFMWDIMLVVDTNGFKKPNKFGKDRFVFWAVNEAGSGVWSTHPYPGTPVKLLPSPDKAAIDYYCGYPPCPTTTWLYN